MNIDLIKSGVKRLDDELAKGDYDRFLSLETEIYNNYIKKLEDPNHYEASYKLLLAPLKRFVEQAGLRGPLVSSVNRRAIVFFVHNLDNDLAHIELLEIFLRGRPLIDKEFPEIYVVGYASDQRAPRSQLLRSLLKRRLIKIIAIPYGFKGFASLIRWLKSGAGTRLVVVGPPVHLGIFLEIFQADRVTWLSMKFRLGAFVGLRRAYAFGMDEPEIIGSTKWINIPPALDREKVESGMGLPAPKKDALKLFCINREEKINNIDFLLAIAEVLKRNPGVKFYWTGRSRPGAIDELFVGSGVGSQVNFIGWVDIEKTLPEVDILIDTPVLSGSVAAKAVARGIPTVLFSNSRSWIDFYRKSIEPELMSFVRRGGNPLTGKLTADSWTEFVDIVEHLIRSPDQRIIRSHLQYWIGSQNFYPSESLSVFARSLFTEGDLG